MKLPITVYHCSLVKIKEFDYTNGVHFGGFYSALEAALRKTKSQDDIIYIHECSFINEFRHVEGFDVGNTENWLYERNNFMKPNHIKVLSYKNRYELDNSLSHYVIEGVIEINKIIKMYAYEAEKLVINYLYS